MKFTQPLVEGRLIKRYKRFLADIELDDGKTITAHTANTGSMLGCSTPGSRVWLSISSNPKRKYAFSWEIVEVAEGVRVGINTGLPNKLVKSAIESGIVNELVDYDNIRPEVRYGKENSRIDLLLESSNRMDCYVEIKNVTLAEGNIAYFPDAVSQRGTKHLRELMEMVHSGYRAVIFYCVQRSDVECIKPADHIDSLYGETLRDAIKKGVEPLAYVANVSPVGISLNKPIPVICD